MKHSRPYLARTLVLGLIMLVISASLLTRLAYLQIRQELEPQKQVDSVYTRTYTEVASRGEILDRNGVPLVSNTLGFKIELDYYNWDRVNQNDVILALCGIFNDAGILYEDNLPITKEVPFAYTYTGPESREAAALDKFVGQQEDWPESLAASRLFTLLCEKYEVDNDLGIYAKRTIIGMRYYLESKQFSAYNNPVVIAADVDIETVAKISELSGSLPGVTIQPTGKRQYDTIYAAHILGRVASINADEYAELKDQGYSINDTLGKEGMEKALEPYLRGVDGKRNVEVSKSTGQVVQEYYLEDPDPGDHCYLTIDLELQKVAEDALASTLAFIKENGEKSRDGKGADVEGGALVVLDVNTGEVLAMASYPTFSLATYVEDLAANNENPMAPLYNRAIRSAYPPGSTFKMATAVAALESSLITPQTKIRDQGIFTAYESWQPKCWVYNRYGGNHGSINVSEALKYSCNYFFYDVAYRMGIDTLNEYAQALGLGQKTGIELPLEAAGNLDGPQARIGANVNQAWYDGITLSAAIGQAGQQLTPLQLANYVATIVNGGTRYQPHLLKEVRDYTGAENVYSAQPVVLDRLDLMDSTIKAIKEGMRGVVTDDGTASSYFRDFPTTVDGKPMGVGGKTGSAETGNDKSANGVFVSFAPFDQPEIVVVVVGEHAGSGGILSPACIEIYKHYFNLPVEDPIEINPVEAAGSTQATTAPQVTEAPVTEPSDPTEPVTDPTETGAAEEPVTEPVESQPQTEETAPPDPLAGTEPPATDPSQSQESSE